MPIHILAGIDFNTGIRGILVVTLAVVLLPGSVYLLLATNTGARLGLLIALAALFGWASILTMTWWITSPANGPRGRNASWKPVEIYVQGSGPARTTQLDKLPPQAKLPTAQQIIADHPEILKNYPNPTQATLSDIANNNPELLPKYMEGIDMGGWRVVPQSAAGDAGTVASTLLTGPGGLFKLATDYKIIGTFDYGGKPTRLEYCGASKEVRTHFLIPGDPVCRVQYKLYKLFHWNSPPHYEVVLVQKVVPQTAEPGHAPPLPEVDKTQPIIAVVMIRDLGQARALPATMFIVAFALFIFFVVLLHYRDLTLRKNLAEDEEERKAIEAESVKV
jgi:hypothetical protein